MAKVICTEVYSKQNTSWWKYEDEDHDVLHDWFFGCKSGKEIQEYAATHGNGITFDDVITIVKRDKEASWISFGGILNFLEANGIWVI